MAIKGSAQQEVDTALTGLDFIQSVIDLAKNPKAVDAMKQSLIEGNTIAESRKKEAQDALKAISDAQAAQIKLEKDKADHLIAVQTVEKQLLDKKTAIETAATALAKDKDASKAAIDAKMAEASRLADEAAARHKSADQRDKDYGTKVAELNDGQAQLKSDQDALARNQKAYSDAVTKFNNRKRALADAAKNASQED